MTQSRFLAHAIFAMAASLAGAGLNAVQSVEKAVMPAAGRRFDAQRGLFGGLGAGWGRSTARRAAYGWTNRHARRVAAKKRNKARHRAASRG